MVEVQSRELKIFEQRDGKCPYENWFEKLETKIQMLVDARLNRLRQGNLKNCRPVGGGVKELKIDFGPGYRIYFGEDGKFIVVLLCGGDKKTQKQDIKFAKKYWDEYQGR